MAQRSLFRSLLISVSLALLLTIGGCARDRAAPPAAPTSLPSSGPGNPGPAPRSPIPTATPDRLRPTPSPDAVGRRPTPRPAPLVVVFLDPGHGGVDTGTIGVAEDGSLVEEKAVALAIALRTADHLRQHGIRVVLSRTDDSLPGSRPSDYTDDGSLLTPAGVLADLQRRIDQANASGARVLLSIHLNSFDDPAVRGTQTFYDSSRPFAAQNVRFAELVQSSVIASLRQHGYDTPDRGIADDLDLAADRFGTLGDGYHHLVVLGPAVPGVLRPTTMPGALNESLFLSNPVEATAAAEANVQELIAGAYARAIEQFLFGQATSQGGNHG